MEEAVALWCDLENEEEEEEELLLLFLADSLRSSPHAIFCSRGEEGFENMLVRRHLLQDESKFRSFYRLNINQFNFVLALIENDLKKHSCGLVKHPISPEEKLGVSLRFMATGESFASLSFAFRISPGYISRIVKLVLRLLRERLPPIFMPVPTTEVLLNRAAEFSHKWNFPNCIAAVDGKHVRIFCPGKSGSLFYNYKDFFSIVLLAFVDANYKFIMVDIGSYGKEGDSGILAKSNLGQLINDTTFYPPPSTLPNSDIAVPFIIVGDEAFRLSKHVMKPFARNVASLDFKKAVFNYRLSRARRVSENAFALLSQVFRIFYLPIAVRPEVTDDLIMTACCIHNMLRDSFLEDNKLLPRDANLHDVPTKNMIPIRATGGFANAEGFDVREAFTHYFSSQEGSLSWQENTVNQTDTFNNT